MTQYRYVNLKINVFFVYLYATPLLHEAMYLLKSEFIKKRLKIKFKIWFNYLITIENDQKKIQSSSTMTH